MTDPTPHDSDPSEIGAPERGAWQDGLGAEEIRPHGGDPFELDAPPPDRHRPDHRRELPWGRIAGAIALLAVLGFGIWWFLFRSPGEPAPAPPPLPAAEFPAPPPSRQPVAETRQPAIELPPLNASDGVVARLVGELSSHPRLAAWLANDDLIRRFVATVANVADGASPKVHLPFLRPAEAFAVRGSADRRTVDPDTWRRYDTLVEVFTSLDTEGSARLYRQLSPLFEAAWQDLGAPDGSVDEALARAIGRLLAVPVLDGAPRLEPRGITWAYADPELEALSPAAKQLLRMGPENVHRVQAKLRELAGALGIEPRPPGG